MDSSTKKMGRRPTPRPETKAQWFHVWTYSPRENRTEIQTSRVVLSKAGGQGPTAVYESTSSPAAWKTRAAATKYGLKHFGAGKFQTKQCSGPRCPMAFHG